MAVRDAVRRDRLDPAVRVDAAEGADDLGMLLATDAALVLRPHEAGEALGTGRRVDGAAGEQRREEQEGKGKGADHGHFP